MSELTAVMSPEPHDGPVVALLLHGYGSSEDDLAGLAPHVVPGLPWASLRSPLTLDPGSYAWFHVFTPGDPALEPVAAATDAIWELVDTHLDASTQLVPIGFSQGRLMATKLLRTRPNRVAATVVLGGFVQGAERPADGLLADALPPLFWGRGSQDTVIAPIAVARTEAWLPSHSTLTRRTYPGLAHAINVDEAADVREFVHQIVGP